MIQEKKKNFGSGVMVFINKDEKDYVLFLHNIRRDGVRLMEPGGRQEKSLTLVENAIKELYEETYACIKVKTLDETKAVLVRDEYTCYPLYLKIGDFQFFKDILDINRKILQQSKDRRLHSFTECSGYEIVELEEWLKQPNFIMKEKRKVQVHPRASGALQQFLKNGVLAAGKVTLEAKQCQLDRLLYPNQNSPLHVLHKQYSYTVN